MPKCTFCKQNYEFPRGLTFILNDGSILYFCSGKCRKNMLKLGRDSKKVKWITSVKERAKEKAEKKEIN